MILPSQTNTALIKHDVTDSGVFKDTVTDWINLGEIFNDEKLTDEWLKKHKAYPAGFDQRMVQRVVIKFPPRYVDGLNGDRKRYLAFQAYHINTKYQLTIRNRYFPIMFPTMSFKSMWDCCVPFSMNNVTGMLIELHFIKKNKKRYEAKFIAQVRNEGEEHFTRLEVFYKEDKYTGDKI
jgi:hypothetical protein